ncbi:MAG: hypothetical protein K8T89_15240 [Planctomycetes bacterium]|nr:hypothetical protein [Planctomycetota bacterium]
MRAIVGILAVVLLGTPLHGEDAARDVIERAFKARAEKPELLEKQRLQIIQSEGKIIDQNQNEIASLCEMHMEWPKNFRWNIDMAMPDGKRRVQMGMQLDKGWRAISGFPSEDLGLGDTEEFKMEIHGRWLASLYPLKGNNVTLSLMRDNFVGDDEVSVVKAVMRFCPEVYLSFSKKTGHLLKVAYRAREQGVDVRKEHLFSEYKLFDGLMLPTKLIDMKQVGARPNAKAAEWKITSYKFVEKFGADAFAMPK